MTVDLTTFQERLEHVLTGWLPWQRWYGSKGRPLAGVRIVRTTEFADALRAGGPRGVILLLRTGFADAGAPEFYQVPLGIRTVIGQELEPYVIAGLDDLLVYEAVGDDELVAGLLDLAGARTRRPGSAAPSRPLGVEQSNTSVVVDERYLLKIFRRIGAGTNPELELPQALAPAANRHVTAVRGAVEGELDGEPVTYATVQDFLPAATDGWAAALDARRGPAADSFARDAHAMGEALARVHHDLAEQLGTRPTGPSELALLADRFTVLLDSAVRRVDALRPFRTPLRTAFARMTGVTSAPPAQRVHGDLHLAQMLRSSGRWMLIDFEGEPQLPMAERAAPHLPLRDVAGMLRSFDYAALSSPTGPSGAAAAWSGACGDAFCAGYARVSGQDPREHAVLLRAHVLARAVHELMYEIDNRPERAPLPLQSIGRLVDEYGTLTGEKTW